MITVETGDILQHATDVAVVNLFEDVASPAGATGAADRALDGLITRLIDDGVVDGKLGSTELVHVYGDAASIAPKRLLIVGLGKSERFDAAAARSAAASAVNRVAASAETMSTIVHGAGIGGMAPQTAAHATAVGSILGAYEFAKYKTSSDYRRRRLTSIVVVEHDAAKLDAIRAGVESGSAVAQAQNLARDLVNEPANTLSPTAMRDLAGQVANDTGMEFGYLNEQECADRDMGAFCGVAQGAREPAYFVTMSHHGAPDTPDHNIWLIGKSITFDSGGLSLKSPTGMRRMKGDMGGGAAVLGAMQVIGARKPAVNVHCILPITENMPGGNAQRPGDIVRTMSGKTIEVDNTDAEGRLTIADAVDYAKSRGASRIIDVATLTGAARVALGTGNSALFANDDGLADAVLGAAAEAGDAMWRMPLDATSRRLNRSKVADVKNSGGPAAGSITAAHFIAHFVGDTPWVHLDIAATAMLESAAGVYKTAGATGVPTRTLVELVDRLA